MCERHYNPLFVNNQDRVEMARLVPNETGKLETGWRAGGWVGGVHLKIFVRKVNPISTRGVYYGPWLCQPHY